MNIEQARTNMLKQQMRPCGVLDDEILGNMTIPREAFVPKAFRKLAYADMSIPIGHGHTLLEPKQEASILQALQLKATDTVLEVGTGTGYFTCLLAQTAKKVYSVESCADFTADAQKRIDNLGISNVTLFSGDGHLGWPEKAPFDHIIFTGGLLDLPTSVASQLAPEGNVVAMLGKPLAQTTRLLTFNGESWDSTFLFDVSVAYLEGAVQPQRFNF